MSRHRNVRSMNYQDEYDGYDDVYGHSVEDGDFCVSPTTAHYYLSDRHNEPSLLGAFMTPDKIKEEDEEVSEEEANDSLQESQDFKRPTLSDIDEARLNSCLEEMRNILGDSTPEHLMVDAVIKCDFDFEKALSYVLSQQEAPKPQRERRQRRDKDPEGDQTTDSSSPPSPTASPPHPKPLSSKAPAGVRDKSPKVNQPQKAVRRSQENNQNIGNVVGSTCGLPAVKHGSGKGSQPGLKPQQIPPPFYAQPMPGSFSLASLAQKYKSESESDGNSSSCTKPPGSHPLGAAAVGRVGALLSLSTQQTGPQPLGQAAAGRVGPSLSLSTQQTQTDPSQAAANTDTTPTSPESPHLSLAALARCEGQTSDAKPKSSLAPRSLAGAFLQQPLGSSNSTQGKTNASFGLGGLAGSFLQPSVNTNLSRDQAQTDLSALPKGSLGLSSLAGSFLGQPSMGTNLTQDQGQTNMSTKPKGSIGLSSLAGSFLQQPSENTTLSQDPKQTNTGAAPQPQGSLGLSSLAGSFLQQTSENTNLSRGIPIASSNQIAPTSRPLPCPGMSLAALAQQQNQSHSPSFHGSPSFYGSPSFQGSPSLSDLAQQHIDSNKDADSCLSLAAMSGKIKSEVSNQFGHNLPLSSVIQGQKDGQQKVVQSHGEGTKPCSGIGGPSLASFAQLHAGEPNGGNAVKKPPPGVATQGVSLSDLAKHHPKETTEVSDLPLLGPGQTGGKSGSGPSKPVLPGLGAVSLADLASQHNRDPPQKSTDPEQLKQKAPTRVKSAVGFIVKAAKPSLFGQTMCVNTHCHNHSVSSDITHVPVHTTVSSLVPFDFATPSPDDIVKAKQRGAFTRTGERAATNNTQQTEKLKFTLKDPPKTKNVIITKTEATPPPEQPPGGVVTFSTTRRRSSGFTPEKDESGGAAADVDSEAIETVRRNLELDMGVGRGEHLEPGKRSPARSRSPAGSANATPKRERDGQEGGAVPRSTPQVKDKRTALKEYERRSEGSKTCINLVVIGHVDAGKSTLMGHTLVQLGFVNKKTIHKYEQESKKMGKASFAFAWVLDETEEERSRGVTMDIAQTRFETDTKVVTLLDAPGHKDFIPNMITGAAQADVAILVVNSTRGEFETGFEAGGQTREHAMLIRSLGVSQLCIAVNKMDTVEWDKQRYDEITKKLGAFLKTAGFRESDVAYIPCSGLSGQNLTNAPTEEKLSSWYTGPTLVQQIDKFKPPERPVEKAFRMCISDVFKGMGSGFSISGTVQAGAAQPGDKVLVMPQGETANVKSVTIDDIPVPYGFAGDNVTVTVTGIDLQHLTVGSILCDPAAPIPVTTRLRARIVIFNIDVPLTAGFPVVFHYGATSEPAHIRKLVSQLHKSTGEVVRKKPRCLTKNSNAVIEIELSRPNCIELYKDYKDLGRFMLRYSGHTIAAGLVTEILKSKGGKAE